MTGPLSAEEMARSLPESTGEKLDRIADELLKLRRTLVVVGQAVLVAANRAPWHDDPQGMWSQLDSCYGEVWD